MKFKERAKQLKEDIPAIFLVLGKKEAPWYAKLLVFATIAYALSPIDLVPDFIPLLGYLDDIILLPLLIAITIKLIPKEIFEQCRAEADGIWKNGRPKRWYYSIPIILIWIVVIGLTIKAFII